MPVIDAIAQQDLIEQTDTGALTTTIPVTFTDVDLTDVGHTAQVTQAVASGVTTGLALDETALIALVTPGAVNKASGASTGSVDLAFSAASTAFDYLANGDVVTLTYTVAIDDHDGGTTPQTFVVTITGTNDDPVVSAVLTDSADQGDAAFTTDLLAGATDADHGETQTLSVASLLYAVDGGAASATPPAGISLDVDGHTLTIDPADPAFDHLAFGEQTVITASYDVTDAQGATASQTETITVTGTNDAPVVAAVLTESADEGDAAFTTDLLAGATDVDHGETATLSVASLLYAVDGGAASATPPAGISLDVDGHTLTIDPADPAFDYLAFGEQTIITVSYDVTDAQGATAPQTETITVTGTNDAPVVDTVAPQDLDVPAYPGTLTASIPVTFNDVDVTDVHTAQVTHVVASGATGSFTETDDADLIALLQSSTLIEPSGSSPGSLHFDINADSTYFDYLGGSDVLTLSYTLEIDDHHGGVTPQTAVVAIHGFFVGT